MQYSTKMRQIKHTGSHRILTILIQNFEYYCSSSTHLDVLLVPLPSRTIVTLTPTDQPTNQPSVIMSHCIHGYYCFFFFICEPRGGALPYWRLDAKRPYLLPSSKSCGPRSSRTEGHHRLSSAR